jgi:hypothetical protein
MDNIITVAMAILLRKTYCVHMLQSSKLLYPRYKIMFEIAVHEIVLYSLTKQS